MSVKLYRFKTYFRHILRVTGYVNILLNFYFYLLIYRKRKVIKTRNGLSILFNYDNLIFKMFLERKERYKLYNQSFVLFEILYPNLNHYFIFPEIIKFGSVYVSKSKRIISRKSIIDDGLQLYQEFSKYGSILNIDDRSRHFVLSGLKFIHYLKVNHLDIIQIRQKIDSYLDFHFFIGPIHGDFHLENILINDNDLPCLIDILDLGISGVQEFELFQLLIEFFAQTNKIRWIDTFRSDLFENFISFVRSSANSNLIPDFKNLVPKIYLFALYRLGFEYKNFGNRYDLVSLAIVFDKILDT